MSQVLAEPTVPVTETTIESVLLDADLFVKYSSPEKAFELLRSSLDRSPHTAQQFATWIPNGASGVQLVENPLGERCEHHVGRMVDRMGGGAPCIDEQVGRRDVGVPALAPP